ncbi:MAG: putative toxin-antitoxin system toxin component, PIN family [Thermotogae bacterium]|jgi:putative PIN family toxin of toxin-antitoxin system|nr:putative toxin-antitoxin system toxin component, PIN family [Thermotogota bacterium]MCL5032534.1 putative toxin-antitoxin system toxin component, PIN family [Thermotogota bacterium]
MNVVLDTNVLISGIINPKGIPADILNFVLNGRLILNLDSRILIEYDRVLKSPKFDFPKIYTEVLLQFIGGESVLITPEPIKADLLDPSDLPFVEVAIYKDAPLITGNIKHFKNIKNLKVYSPKDFLKKFSV